MEVEKIIETWMALSALDTTKDGAWSYFKMWPERRVLFWQFWRSWVPLHPFVEPRDDSLVPDHAVAGLQHPMTLIWKVKKLGRYPSALERGKGGNAFAVDQSIVLCSVNH